MYHNMCHIDFEGSSKTLSPSMARSNSFYLTRKTCFSVFANLCVTICETRWDFMYVLFWCDCENCMIIVSIDSDFMVMMMVDSL